MSCNFVCVDCTPSSEYSKLEELEAHIASDHLAFLPYSCDKCQYAKFPTEFSLVEHHKRTHNQIEFVVLYRYTPDLKRKRKELEKKVSICTKNSLKDLSTIDISNSEDVFNIFDDARETVQEEAPYSPLFPSLFDDSTTSENSLLRLTPFFISKATESAQPKVDSRESSTVSDQTTVSKIPKQQKHNLVQCALCPEIVSKARGSLLYHTNTRHTQLVLYQCDYCGRQWTTIAKSDVIKHMKTNHAEKDGVFDESKILDFRKKHNPEIKKMAKECFPTERKRYVWT